MKYNLNDKVKIISSHFSDGTEIAGGSVHHGETGVVTELKPKPSYDDVKPYDYMVQFPDGALEPFMEQDLGE